MQLRLQPGTDESEHVFDIPEEVQLCKLVKDTDLDGDDRLTHVGGVPRLVTRKDTSSNLWTLMMRLGRCTAASAWKSAFRNRRSTA